MTHKEIASFLQRAEHKLSILDNHNWTCTCIMTPYLRIGWLAQTSQYLRLTEI